MEPFKPDMISREFNLMDQWNHWIHLQSTEQECLVKYITLLRNACLRYGYMFKNIDSFTSDHKKNIDILSNFTLDKLNIQLENDGTVHGESEPFYHGLKKQFFEHLIFSLYSTDNSPFEQINEGSNRIRIRKTPYLYPCLTDPEKITDLTDFEFLSIFEFYFLIGVHLGFMLLTPLYSIGDVDQYEFSTKIPLSHTILHNLILTNTPNIDKVIKNDDFKKDNQTLRANIDTFFVPIKKILKTLDIDPLKGIDFLSKWFSFRETEEDFTDLILGELDEKLWNQYNVNKITNTANLGTTKTILNQSDYTDSEHVKKLEDYTTAFIEYYSCKYIHKYKIEGGDNSIPFKGSTASDEEIQLENKLLSEVLRKFAIQEYSAAASPNGEATDPREFLYEVSKTVKDPTSVYNMYPVLDITMFNYLYRQSVLYLLRTDLDINLSKENYQNYYEDVDQTDEADPSSMRFSKKMFKYIKKEYSNPTAKELGDIRALLDLIKCIYLVRHKKQLFGKDVNTLQKCITTGFQQTLKLKFRYTPPKLTDNTDFKEFLKVKSLSKQNDDEILTLISDKIVPSVEIIKENVFKNRNLSPEKFDQYKKAIIAYLQPSEDDENPKKKIADFYKFVTGTSSTPLLIELNEITGGSDDLLPGSQTCFNTLYFYNYSTVDVFIQRLKVAISSTMIGGRNNNKIKINYKLK